MRIECQCSSLSEIARLEDHADQFRKMQEVEQGNWCWLNQCQSCGQLWRVDVWDKGHTQFVIKIAQRDGWKDFDTIPLRKRYLVQSYGGLTDETCSWAGCSGRCVKGVAFCVDHLWNTASL